MAPLKIIILGLFLLYGSLALTNEQRIGERAKTQFQQTDKNKDNIVSLKQMIQSFDELLHAGFDKAKLHQLTKQSFETYDTDTDGELTWEEYLNMTVTKVQNTIKQAQRKRLDPPELDSI